MRRINPFFIIASAAALAACATETPAPAPPTGKVDIPYGYQRVVTQDGVERYCRNDVDTGSRVTRTKICYTAQQLKASQENTQNFLDSVQAHGAMATATGMPGAGGMASSR
ncbi:MAG TPA: hypothetical protein VIY90_03930 [Steroidobacteraceae bacterium]